MRCLYKLYGINLRKRSKLLTIKWQKIHTYQQVNLKNKLSKQEEQRQNHVFGERFDGCQMGRRYGGMGEEVRRLRSTNMQLQNSHMNVKYSVGNGVAKELTPVDMNSGEGIA